MVGFLLAAFIVSPALQAQTLISSTTVRDPHDLILGAAPASAEMAKAPFFQESLEFDIEWGYIGVGKAQIEAKRLENFNGTPTLRIETGAVSNKFCDTFYPVRDRNESWMASDGFYSMGYTKKLREGGFFRDEWVLYNYPDKTWISRTTGRDGNYSVKVGTVPGLVQDILSSLYYIRTKPLHMGDDVIMDVNTKENWPLVVKVLREETVEVPAGKFKCVVVQPFLRKEGIFIQKGKNLLVWLTDDPRHLPVKLSVEVFFGHVTASLAKHSP